MRTRVSAIPAVAAAGWPGVAALRALSERDEVAPPLQAASNRAARIGLRCMGNLRSGVVRSPIPTPGDASAGQVCLRPAGGTREPQDPRMCIDFQSSLV